MGYIGPGALGGKGCRSGVGKQVQDLGGGKAVCLVDAGKTGGFPVDEFPVWSLLREHANVLEGG